MDQSQRIARLRALHQPGRPLVLFNVWDAGSGRAVAQAGAQALGTSSWAVAHAAGVDDGEVLTLAHALQLTRQLVAVSDLPVTVDLERGHAASSVQLAANITELVLAGAAGCNLEDSLSGDAGLRSVQDQAARLRAARDAAHALQPGFFINARCDIFLQQSGGSAAALLPQALERARAYAQAGADGYFAPGLSDEDVIGELVHGSPLPVNIMTSREGPGVQRLAALGVARVSHGPDPYLAAMAALQAAARTALQVPADVTRSAA